MHNSTPLKRPLGEHNLNITFAPVIAGQLSLSPKRKYSKNKRFKVDSPRNLSTVSANNAGATSTSTNALLSIETPSKPSATHYDPFQISASPQPSFAAGIERLPQPLTPSRKPGETEVIKTITDYLQGVDWTLYGFLDALLTSGNQQISAHVSRTLNSKGGLLLDKIEKKCPVVTRTWVEAWIEREAEREGERLVDEMLPSENLSNLLAGFSMSGIMTRTEARCPLLWKCLRSTGRRSKKDLESHRRNRDLVYTTVVCMLAQARSERANAYQAVMSFWLLASGSSRAAFDVLHHAGLSVSYNTAVRRLKKLSDERLQCIRSLAKERPFIISWDNLCLRHDVAEQREDNNSRFLSGTTASLIELVNMRLGDLRPTMLRPRLHRQPILTFGLQDILPSLQQTQQLDEAMRYQVVKILFQYFPSLKTRFPNAVKPPVVHRIPVHKTAYHSLPYLTIDESSLDGTIKIIETIFSSTLGMSSEDIKRHGLIICSGDLLTWSLTDKACATRRCDDDFFENLSKWVDKMIGLFHVKMAGTRMVGNEYWGKPNGRAMWSLWKVNSLLCRRPMVCGWKASKLAPFQPLTELILTFALPANVLDGWRLECGRESLSDWVDSVSDIQDITDLAKRVLVRIASRRRVSKMRREPMESRDLVLENITLFNYDALVVLELKDSIRDGDIGRVLNVLAHWMVEFRGTGSMPKYADALFETLTTLKQMDPIRREAHLMNWLVNVSGKPGHFKEVDLLQEHENFFIKIIYQARGVNKNDEWLRVVSLCLWALRSVLKRVGDEYEVRSNGTSHTSPDTQKDIAKLLDYLQMYSIQSYTRGRDFNSDTPEARNLFANGTSYFNTPKAFKNFTPDNRQAFYKARTTPPPARDGSESESESESESQDVGSFPDDFLETMEAYDGELTGQDLEDDDLFTESTIAAIRDMAQNLTLDQ